MFAGCLCGKTSGGSGKRRTIPPYVMVTMVGGENGDGGGGEARRPRNKHYLAPLTHEATTSSFCDFPENFPTGTSEPPSLFASDSSCQPPSAYFPFLSFSLSMSSPSLQLHQSLQPISHHSLLPQLPPSPSFPSPSSPSQPHRYTFLP